MSAGTDMRTISASLFVLIVTTVLTGRVEAQQAPDFALLDGQGNTISLSDYQGKPLILHFWATWCPYCERLQPGLESLYQDFKDDGLEVLAISFSERGDADPQQVLRERGMSFPTAINGDRVAQQYGVMGTPTTFFITRSGAVVWVTNFSDPNDPRFEEAVEFLLDN